MEAQGVTFPFKVKCINARLAGIQPIVEGNIYTVIGINPTYGFWLLAETPWRDEVGWIPSRFVRMEDYSVNDMKNDEMVERDDRDMTPKEDKWFWERSPRAQRRVAEDKKMDAYFEKLDRDEQIAHKNLNSDPSMGGWK